MLDQVSILQNVVIIQCCVALDVGYLVLQLKCAIYAHFLDILHAILPCLVDINRSYHKTAGKGAQIPHNQKTICSREFYTRVYIRTLAVYGSACRAIFHLSEAKRSGVINTVW